MTAIAKLRRHRELGLPIQSDFCVATPETAAGMVKRAQEWKRDLIPLVEPMGHGAAALFKPLTPMKPEEQETVARCAPLDRRSSQVRANHAVRMYRLNELFNKFPPVLPKGKGGNRRKYDDGPIVAKAIAILNSSGTKNKAAAVREAAKRFPRLFHGDGDPSNIVKRIVAKMQFGI